MHSALRKHLLSLALLFIAFALVIAYWLALRLDGPNAAGLLRLLDLNGEANVPAWYASFLWTLAAMRSFRIFQASREPEQDSRQAIYWAVVAAICLYLSLDETAKLHEAVGFFSARRVGDPGDTGPIYQWVWFGLSFVALVLLGLSRFMLRLPRTTVLGLVVSGAVFLSGAIGLEVLGSIERSGVISWPWGLNRNRTLAIEEFLEMAGILILLVVLRRHEAWLALQPEPIIQNRSAAARA